MNKKAEGTKGEIIAENFLKDKGYKVLQKNFVLIGIEVDLVAKTPDNTFVFCEVKTRNSTEFGQPSEAVTKVKIKRYVTFAKAYMVKYRLFDANFRFDVIEILNGKINHIESAFDAN